jgi:hypothetical protein
MNSIRIKKWLGKTSAACLAWLKNQSIFVLNGRDLSENPDHWEKESLADFERAFKKIAVGVSREGKLDEAFLQRSAANAFVGFCIDMAEHSLNGDDPSGARDYILKGAPYVDDYGVRPDEFWETVEKTLDEFEEKDKRRVGYSGPRGHYATFLCALYGRMTQNSENYAPGPLAAKVIDRIISVGKGPDHGL